MEGVDKLEGTTGRKYMFLDPVSGLSHAFGNRTRRRLMDWLQKASHHLLDSPDARLKEKAKGPWETCLGSSGGDVRVEDSLRGRLTVGMGGRVKGLVSILVS